jgi:hypothetical protein
MLIALVKWFDCVLISSAEEAEDAGVMNGAVRCQRQGYCLNGGTCYVMEFLGTQFCRSVERFRFDPRAAYIQVA